MYHLTGFYEEQVLHHCLFENDNSYDSYCSLCFGNCAGKLPVGATVRLQPVRGKRWFDCIIRLEPEGVSQKTQAAQLLFLL